jgi:hypothetical protein
MTNIPPGDPVPPRDPRPARAKVDRRGHIAIGVVAAVLIIAAILYFSAASQHPDNPAQTAIPGEVNPDPSAGQGQDTSGTPPAPTEPGNAPADSNSGTTNQ